MTPERIKKRIRAAKTIVSEMVDCVEHDKSKIYAIGLLAELRDEVEGAIVYLRCKADDDRKNLKKMLMRQEFEKEDR